MIIEPQYKIGDRVYGALPDSPVGIVVDVSYLFSTKKTEYQVTFDIMTNSLWYNEVELSDTKTF